MEFWIWLSNALGPGSPRINDIVACFETAEHFYAEKKTGFRHIDFLTAAEKQKLYAFLMRRGFSSSGVRRVLQGSSEMQNEYS